MAKNVLITGGTGFLGSHLIHSLLDNNYQVILELFGNFSF